MPGKYKPSGRNGRRLKKAKKSQIPFPQRRPLIVPGGMVGFADGELRGCAAKVVFGSEREAQAHADRFGYDQEPYRCPHCGSVHLRTRRDDGRRW